MEGFNLQAARNRRKLRLPKEEHSISWASYAQ